MSAEPYWLVIERGLSLGYRKSSEGGAWLVRRYDGTRRRHRERRLGTADDYRDADGADVLTFQQAQRQLLEAAHEQALDASGERYTVTDAVHDYVDWLHRNRKSAEDTEAKLRAYVLSSDLAGKRLADLKAADFESWLTGALKRRRRTRKKGAEAREAVAATETKEQASERLRRRKATLNRVINSLKACLNHAATNGKPANRDAWARIKKFRSADSARLRWLTVDEAQRLQNAAPPDLRMLVAAGLNTGCRAGELLALRAGDYDHHSKTLLIADSKSSKPRRVPLTEDGVTLFGRLTAGKIEDESLFRRADGSAWYRVALVRAMRTACAAARVRPVATFHTLRHTYASHLVQKGVPLIFVAEALGHSDARMVTKHYGHLAPSHVADAIRAALPKFGIVVHDDVTSLRAHKA
ncbi:MAG TPA: site-specific integrase [Steroidobacteraceae bacterium]|nr:site-specific integrase [Steroidobacteraceae bacterium]